MFVSHPVDLRNDRRTRVFRAGEGFNVFASRPHARPFSEESKITNFVSERDYLSNTFPVFAGGFMNSLRE